MENDTASSGMKKELNDLTYPDNSKKPKKINARDRAVAHLNYFLMSAKAPDVHSKMCETDIDNLASYLGRK